MVKLAITILKQMLRNGYCVCEGLVGTCKIFIIVVAPPFLVWGLNGRLPSTSSSGFLLCLIIKKRWGIPGKITNNGWFLLNHRDELFQSSVLFYREIFTNFIQWLTHLQAKWIFRQARFKAFLSHHLTFLFSHSQTGTEEKPLGRGWNVFMRQI